MSSGPPSRTSCHFSGRVLMHPRPIVLVNDLPALRGPVSARAIRQLFKSFKDNIRVVVLNACYSNWTTRRLSSR